MERQRPSLSLFSGEDEISKSFSVFFFFLSFFARHFQLHLVFFPPFFFFPLILGLNGSVVFFPSFS